MVSNWSVDEVLGGDGSVALGPHDRRTRGQARDAVAGHELHQVTPVRADVGERPGGSSGAGVHAPVVAGRRGKPVLEVAPVDDGERAEVAGGHLRPHLADHGVEPVDERHRGDALAGLGLRGERASRLQARRQRLLADHVQSFGQGGLDLLGVQRVRRTDMEYVGLGDQLLEVHRRLLRAGGPNGGVEALGGGGQHSGDPSTRASYRLGVDLADHSGARDRHSEWLGRGCCHAGKVSGLLSGVKQKL